MKKFFAYIIMAAMLATVLSGCGRRVVEDNNRVETVPSAIPSTSPFVTPDMQDGIVDDKDGVIEDENGRNEHRDDKTNTSPSPTVTPSDNTNP